MTHAKYLAMTDSPKLYLTDKGELTLTQVRDLIVEGDLVCVENLLQTIQDTINANGMVLHAEAVKKLHGKCIILSGLLSGKQFQLKGVLEAAFARLSNYAGIGIFPHLH